MNGQQLNLFDLPAAAVATGNGAAPAKITPALSVSNYTIAKPLATGGVKTWFKRNVAAIELLKQIEAEKRRATQEEKDVLVEYVGWGGMPQAFDRKNLKWAEEYRILDDLLDEAEYAAARRSMLNAHYSSIPVIKEIWRGVQRLGFKRGTVVEPALGIGHFFGAMPAELREKSTLYGVELDSISARIAKLLYPLAQIEEKSIHEFRFNQPFDLTISNVPFGDYKLPDMNFYRNGRGNLRGANIHDYYFIKALDLTRTGGLIVFITSRYTLDKAEQLYRHHLAGKAALLGAVRLPSIAFKENANTETTMDILFLQKTNEPDPNPIWIPAKSVSEGNFVNSYFLENPGQMLGQMQVNDRKRKGQMECVSDKNWIEKLPALIEKLPEGVYKNIPTGKQRVQAKTISIDRRRPYVQPEDKPWLRESSYDVDEWFRVWQKRSGRWQQLDYKRSTSQIRDLCHIRDAFRRVIAANVEYMDDEELKSRQEALSKAYDAFVRRWGPINSPGLATVFSQDPDYYPMRAIEAYNPETGQAKKREIFTQRIVLPAAQREVKTAQDAMLVSLDRYGFINVNYIPRLLGDYELEHDYLKELAEQDLIYEDPEVEIESNGMHQWVLASRYLSGNVRRKLKVVKQLVAAQPELAERYRRNIEALAEVIPEDLRPQDITCNFGAMWVPDRYVTQFINEVIFSNIARPGLEAVYTSLVATWSLNKERMSYLVNDSADNTQTWGTSRAPAVTLLEKTLNNQFQEIHDTVKNPDGTEGRVKNEQETLAAQAKQEAIKAAWKSWVYQDEDRAKDLARIYNDAFNGIVKASYDGSHLTLPGLNASVELRPHQKNAIWRGIVDRNLLLGHIVGAGKTYVMIAIAMELKRLGIVNKPVMTVKKSTFGNIVAEAYHLYPNANILAISALPKNQRKYMTGRIAMEDWDMVIMTHETFGLLNLKPETIEYWYREQIVELNEAIALLEAKDPTQKQLEKRIAKLEFKIDMLRSRSGRKDNGLYFEELGIDALIVDESQKYKNLFFATKMTRLPGVGGSESGMAYDAFMKIRWIQANKKKFRTIFSTGTPIENTIGEMFTLKRFLYFDELKEMNLNHFDAWANVFGDTVTSVEMRPDGGGFRTNTRFARFNNVPELLKMFWSFADIQMDRQALGLKVPELVTGRPIGVTVEPSQEVLDITAELVERAENLDPAKKHIDNMLKIVGEARKAALDTRLLGRPATMEDNPDSKVNAAIRNILEGYHKPPSEAARCQAVFLDLYRSDEFNVIEDMKLKLRSGGVKPEEIWVAQETKNDDQKAEMQKRARQGQIRVCIGSTQTLGIGVNIQDRLFALHNLDVPWKPAEYEQRLGRIERQGNLNEEIYIYNYLTERTFDVFMWETNSRKAKFIAQIMTGDLTVRTVEDIDAATITYQEMVAISSGNPIIMEKVKLESDIAKYKSLEQQHYDSRRGVERKLERMRHERALDQSQAMEVRQLIERVQAEGKEPLYRFGQELFEKVQPLWHNYSIDPIGMLYGLPVIFDNQKLADSGPARSKAAHVVRFFAERDAKRRGEELPKEESQEEQVKSLQRVTIKAPARAFEFRIHTGKEHKKLNVDKLADIFSTETLEAVIKTIEERIADNQTKAEQYQKVIDQPFEHGKRLAEMLQRLAEINEELENQATTKKGTKQQ